MRRLTACLIALTTAACGGAPGPEEPTRATPSGPSQSASDAASPTEGSSPTELVAGALDLLECDGEPSDVGGAGEQLTLESRGGATPQEAVDAFLGVSPYVIPRSGYEPIALAGERHAYAYRHRGEVKVVLVVSPRFADLVGTAFSADELRTCPSGEFGADADFGDGRRAWTDPVTGHVITDIAGPTHCGWETARLMHLEHPDGSLDRQYVRDPNGVLPGAPLLDTYAEGVELPDDAIDSGYRSPEGFELWFTASDTAAYVVTPDGIERWPRADEPIGCA